MKLFDAAETWRVDPHLGTPKITQPVSPDCGFLGAGKLFLPSDDEKRPIRFMLQQ